MLTYIIVKRLAWAGQLIRVNNDRSIQTIFNTNPDGARRVGRWEVGVDQDTGILGVKNWKKIALDRDE
jgi:hypothetical protein